MRSPMHGVQPPYRLPSNVVYFHDWRYVNCGAYAWAGRGGESVPIMGVGDVPAMEYRYVDMPLGVSLVAQRPTKTGPVLHAEQTGDTAIFAESLIHEDGVYRLFYESWPHEHFDARGDTSKIGSANAVRYAESADGITWKRPRVTRLRDAARRDQNVVFGGAFTGKIGFHGGCVFKDPSAKKSERYKSLFLGFADRAMYDLYRRKRPDDVDPFALRALESGGKAHVLFGAVSPDGFTWKVRREPVVFHFSDTANTCHFDPIPGKYVAYVRTWVYGRRSIGRCESDDFRDFTFPEQTFWPDASQAPHDTWYANGKTTMPNAPDYHLMFPMRWHLPTDHFDLHLASSPDNVMWGFVPGPTRGEPVIAPGNVGEWDGGVVVPGQGLVDLPGNRTGLLYSATPVPHKYPRRIPFGGVGWATWTRDRIVALHAPVGASFSLWPLTFDGRTARLNYRTKMTGYLRVEARVDGQPLAGRAFADCDVVSGDETDRTITWRGKSDLGHQSGQAVALAFEMRNADLFAVRFE